LQASDNVTVKVVSNDVKSIDSRRTALRASLGLQVKAMFIKNLHFQKRRKWSNCCLCVLPVFFIAILVALQIIINSLLLGSGNFTCPDDPSTATNAQRTWCAIANPIAYPPLLKLSTANRAPNAFLHTGTNSNALADEITFSDAEIDAAFSAKWDSTFPSGGFKSMLWTGLNASCNIADVLSFAEFSTFMETNCQITGDMTRPAAEFSAIAWSDKAKGITSSPSPQMKLIMTKLANYPGGMDAFSACASKGLSFMQNSSLLAFAPIAEPRFPMGTFARLNQRVYEDPAFAPAFMQGSAAASGDAGRFGNIAYLARNCSSLSNKAKCYIFTVCVTKFIYTTCFSTNPLRSESSTAMQASLYKGFFNRLKGVPYEAVQQYAAAFDWKSTSTTAPKLDATLYANLSGISRNGQGPPRLVRLPEIMNMVTNAFIQSVFSTNNANVEMTGMKEMPKPKNTLNLDFSSLLGPLLYVWVVQLPMPVVLINIVYEKEFKLRTMMKMMGLSDAAYWLITFSYNLLVYIVYLFLFIALGALARLSIFTLNSFSVTITLYLLFAFNQVSMAFLWGALFKFTRTANVSAYLWVLASGVVANFVVANLVNNVNTDPGALFGIQLIPPFALFRGLNDLAEYAFQANYQGIYGMKWSNIRDPRNGIADCYAILFVEGLLFLVGAAYLQQVYGDDGIKRHPLFFLGMGKKTVTSDSELVSKSLSVMPPDVQHERSVVSSASAVTHGVIIKDLNKIYETDTGVPKMAVKTLSLAIPRGQCVGLLGPNGAGKSTTVSMLCGFFEPSAGTALVEGYDITKDMDSVYTLMSVCPQDNLLWETLTGEEHLYFYGRLKNLQGAALDAAVDEALSSVNLAEQATRQKLSGEYSGGMKRRLSVAISLIGSPLVVYLDEPSTGLDPASRHQLWEAILKAKKDRTIILTTHSMEEAEVLCDKIGIFVAGELRCYGAPQQLTHRYGSNYSLTVTVNPGMVPQAQLFLSNLAPGAVASALVGDTLRCSIPISSISPEQIFTKMEAARQSVGVRDWGVANASLEDVFIQIASPPLIEDVPKPTQSVQQA